MKQASFLGFLFAFLSIISCKQPIPTSYQGESIAVNDELQPAEEIQQLVAPYKDSLDKQMNQVIGVFAEDMKKTKPESSLGNFMCDATQTFYNKMYGGVNAADFTVMNYGGIRLQHISKGEVTVETMFELMPFENEIVVVDMPAEVVEKLFKRIAAMNGWPVSEQIYLRINNQQIDSLAILDKPLQHKKMYRVLLSDYVANGGDGMDFLEQLHHQRTGLKLRDVLIAYCEWKTERGEEIKAPITGRMIEIDSQ